MPLKGMFARQNSSVAYFRIHKKLLEIIKNEAKERQLTLTELVNNTLAEHFAPELQNEFLAYYQKRTYSFPNRKRKTKPLVG